MDRTLVYDSGTTENKGCCSPLEAIALSNGGLGGANAMLPAMMMGGGGFGGGFGGYNSPLWVFILLAFLRNGGLWGNGENNAQLSQIQDTLNTNQGNTLIMNAIQGNATSIKELASVIGCNQNALTTAINGIQSAICNVGNQVGMTSANVINAINNGNMQLANSLQSCCCDVRNAITTQGYESRIATLNQTNQLDRAIAGVDSTVVKGFCDTAYATQQQTNALAQNSDANTRAVIAKLDQIEDSRKDREIASLTAALTAANSRAERAAELAPIVQKLNDINCKQPNTVTVPYQPFVTVPNCVAYNALGAGVFGLQSQGGIFG